MDEIEVVRIIPETGLVVNLSQSFSSSLLTEEETLN
jgi:hypothetical protein